MHAADAEADQSAPRSASAAMAFTIVTPTLGRYRGGETSTSDSALATNESGPPGGASNRARAPSWRRILAHESPRRGSRRSSAWREEDVAALADYTGPLSSRTG